MDNYTSDNEEIEVLIETAKYIIKGELVIPMNSSVNFPSTDNLLLSTLNSGNKFISMRNCIVTSKDNAEFQPERSEYFAVNLDIVHTCRIVKK